MFRALSDFPLESHSFTFSLLFWIFFNAVAGSRLCLFFSFSISWKSNFKKKTPFSVLTPGLVIFAPMASASLPIVEPFLPALIPICISFCFSSFPSFSLSKAAILLFNFFAFFLSLGPNEPRNSSIFFFNLSCNSSLLAARSPGFLTRSRRSLGVKDCHLLADSCAAPQLPVTAFLHIGSVLPVEESRILVDNSQLLALTRPCKLGHIGGREEVEGDGDTTIEAHAKCEESGEGGEEKVDAEEQLHENGMGCWR